MSQLHPDDQKDIVEFYLSRYQRFGLDVRALESGGAEKQHIRHTVHAQLFNLHERHVLDVGCGIGMFYEYLVRGGTKLASYTGIDIVQAFVDANKMRFPEAQFILADAFSEPLDDLQQPDVVFISQLFNIKFRHSQNDQIVEAALSKLFEMARVGLVADFLTSYVNFQEDGLCYYSPAEMLELGKSLADYVEIKHDYLPFEFTLVLRKAPILPLASRCSIPRSPTSFHTQLTRKHPP